VAVLSALPLACTGGQPRIMHRPGLGTLREQRGIE